MPSREKLSVIRFLPACPIRRARPGSARRASIAAARAAASLAGTSRPDTPSSTASGVPPTRVATMGVPAAIDSSSEFDSPSLKRSEEHTSELQSPCNLVCRLLLEKKKKNNQRLQKYDTRNDGSRQNPADLSI